MLDNIKYCLELLASYSFFVKRTRSRKLSFFMNKTKSKETNEDVIFRMYFRHWRTGKIIRTGKPIPIKVK